MDRDESSSPRPHGDKGLQAAAAAARASSTSAQAVAAAAALNYSAFLNASVASHGDPSAMLTSTENLLRNIQGLLKVAAENARQQDRQANYEKGRCESQTMSACVCVRARVCVCSRRRWRIVKSTADSLRSPRGFVASQENTNKDGQNN